jgi:hypothetical protein
MGAAGRSDPGVQDGGGKAAGMARCGRKPPRLGDAIAETVMPTLPQRSGGACQKTTASGRIGALAGMSIRSRGAEAPAMAAIARARFLSSGPSATAPSWTDGGCARPRTARGTPQARAAATCSEGFGVAGLACHLSEPTLEIRTQ